MLIIANQDLSRMAQQRLDGDSAASKDKRAEFAGLVMRKGLSHTEPPSA